MRFSYNSHGKNKEWDYYKLTNGFKDTEGTVDKLVDIVGKGWAINGSWFGGKPRSKANVIHNGLICLDFDNTELVNDEKVYNPLMTWEDAINHPFFKDYACLAYTSPSYRDDWHKLRVVIPLPEGVDNDTYTELCKHIAAIVGGCDPACKDPGRVFYGNDKAKFHRYNPTKKISLELIEECRQKARLEKERQALEREKQLKWLESQNPEDNKRLALEALRFIPPRGNKGDGRYPECLQVAFSICAHFGIEALAIIESWSPTDLKNGWNPKKIVDSYNGGVKEGTVFYIAQSYGWRFPDRERWVDPRDPKGSEYDEYERFLEQEAFTDQAIAHEKKQNRLQRWLDKLLTPKGKRAKVKRELPKEEKVLRLKTGKGLPSPEQWEKMGKPIILFSDGTDRAKILQEAIDAGYTYIWDNSIMGLGKSHAVPDLVNAEGKIFYISQDHRNPTTEGIKNEFTDLVPRSKYGFTERGGKLVKADQDTHRHDLVIAPNCHQAPLFEQVYSSGHNLFNEDGINPICSSCPSLNPCRGKGFLNLHARQLQNKRIRADINSLDRFSDYSKDDLVIDELKSLPPTKKISTTYAQLLLEQDRLRGLVNPEIYTYLDSLVQAIKVKFGLEQGKYGLPTEEFLEGLPTHPYLGELIEFLEATPLDLEQYFQEPDHVKTSDKRFKNVSRFVNSSFNREALKETRERLGELPANALILILKMLKGEPIQARLEYNHLTLTVDNRFYTPIFEQSKATVLLDGTASREDVEMVTGVKDWLVIKQDLKKPLANLTINLIETEGLGHNDPSEKALERVRHLLETLQPQATLGMKKHSEALELSGYWFKDNIGSNDYKGLTSLAFVGTPAPNIGQVKDEYLSLGGEPANFERHYQGLRDEQILQAIGRPRCHQFPEQIFKIDWIGTDLKDTLDLDHLQNLGATVNLTTAYEVNPLAGTGSQLIKLGYLEATAAALRDGLKITQTAIAQKLLGTQAVIGKAQSTISENLNRWGITTQDLKELAQKIIGSPIYNLYSSTDNLQDADYRAFIGLDQIVAIAETLAAVATMSWQDVKAIILDFGEKPLQLEALRLLFSIFEETEEERQPYPK